MPLSQQQRAATIREILATKQKLIDRIDTDMDNLDDQLQALDDKVAAGETLTEAETRQRQIFNDSLNTLQVNAQRIELMTLERLDNSAAVAGVSSEINQANQELTQVQQQIKNLTDTINQLNDFLKGVTSLLTSLTGLLATLAVA